MAKKSVYMDYNATTPLHPEVKQEMIEALDLYGNPSSMHEPGRRARNRVEHVRQLTAAYIGAAPDEVVFTGGGSESNNTVIKMYTCAGCHEHCAKNERSEIITSAIEHPSVLEATEYLESNGKIVHYLPVDKTGKIDLDVFKEKISSKTGLVTLMMANNEIGTIQDIKTMTQIAHEHGALVHTDAVQAIGRIPVNVNDLGVDYLSFSGHKFYGPKGIGVLYSRRAKPFCRFIHGGHQEAGRRAGTTNALGIIGMGKALEMAAQEMDETVIRVKAMRDRLEAGLKERIPDMKVNGHPTDRLCNTLNASFEGAEGEAVLLYLDLEGIAVSTGSACSTGTLEPSHVLLATGVGPELAHGSIRFSLGRETTDDEVDYVMEAVPPIINRVRKMSTVYDGGCR